VNIYAPVSGKIVEVNEELDSSPEKINDDADGEGWIVRLKLQMNRNLTA
jgi:glycine cleavage system H protein